MTPALMVIISDANFAGVVDPLIQGVISDNGFTHYITGTLTPPGNTVYVVRQNANGSFLQSQSRQPAYTVVTDTFFGWPIPA